MGRRNRRKKAKKMAERANASREEQKNRTSNQGAGSEAEGVAHTPAGTQAANADAAWSADIIEKILNGFIGLLGLAGGMVLLVGHTSVALWLWFLASSLWCVIGFAHYREWQAGQQRRSVGLAPRICLLLIVGALGVGTYILDREADRTAQAEEFPHLLQPGNGATPGVSTIVPIPEGAIQLFLGNSVAWTSAFPVRVIRQQGESMLEIGRNDEGMWVSGKFFNRDGKAICQIVENNLHPSPTYTFRIDRVADNRLKVIDDELHEVLDVEIINDRAIRILGEFYIRDGKRISITPGTLEWPFGTVSENVFGEFRTAVLSLN